MRDRDTGIEGFQRDRERGGRVPLHKKEIRLYFIENLFHFSKDTRRKVSQSLAFFHQVQVEVGFDPEKPKDLINHFPVLARQARQNLKLFLPVKGFYHRRHFQRLRPRPKNKKDTRLHLRLSRKDGLGGVRDRRRPSYGLIP